MEETTFVSAEEAVEWQRQLEREAIEPIQLEEPIFEDEEPLSAEVLGLLYVGKLSKRFNYQGHDMVIKTLTIGEELTSALIVKELQDTGDYARAMATVLVAACIESVDGRPLVSPLGPSQNDLIQKKYDYIREKWYWPTIRSVYDKYVELLKEQEKAMGEFEKK